MLTRLLPLPLVALLACSTTPTPVLQTASSAGPVDDDAHRELVAAFLSQAQTSMVDATQRLGTAAFHQDAVQQDAICMREAAEAPDEVPSCGSDHFTFGWQEPLELASVDVLQRAGDTMTVRANMRYPEGFLDTPKNDPPHFFAQLDLVRVDGIWRVADARYDDEAVARDRN